ncbi:MAG: tetratricopeptide repeat protein [Planctomycetes bacterium]|nr:tetratricopeptide repeat protein [Planctomycetota bacterium]
MKPRLPLPFSRRLVALLCALLANVSAAHAQANADEQYRYLAGLVEKGMYELAAGEAQSFLRAFPKHEKAQLARYRLASALWELERHDEAAREYETVARLERFEYRAEALFRCGEAARERGDAARERAAFEGVLAAGQDYLVAPAQLALAEADFRARRFEEAERRYAVLLREKPDSAEAPLARRGLAWCAWERGDATETVARTRAFLKQEDDPARRDELTLLLGEAQLAADPKAALETFRSLRTKEQAEARARGEGFALAALGDHAAAAQAFEGLLQRAPEGRFASEAALQAGIERLRGGEAKAAVQRLAFAARDGKPETAYWLAQAQKQAGEPKAALATLDTVLRAPPAGEGARELVSRIHVLRGDCLAADGRAAEAQAAYETSGSDQALSAAAVAALNQGDVEAAVELAQKALRGVPVERAQGARVVLAEALFAAKRFADAERALEAALKQPADAAEAARLNSRRAWCRYLGGDLEAARERFTQLAASRTGEGEEALSMLLRIAEEQGDSAAAAAAAQHYAEAYPRGRFADQAELALARAASGAAGRTRFDEWLKRYPQSPLRASVLLELAELESNAGAHEQAARRYTEVAERQPGTPEAARAAYGLAWCAWQRKDYPGCERALGALAQQKGADAALRAAGLELALWSQVARGALDEALASWRALGARDTGDARRLGCARRLVEGLRGAQRLAEAEALLDECQKGFTDKQLVAEVQLERAYLALERDDLSGAESALARAKKAGASDTAVAEASFHLGEARFAAGDTDAALALYSGAAAVEQPRAADALYRLGFTRFTRGELDQAERALTTLLERQPEGELAPEARFLLGECAFRAGRFELAATRLAAVRAPREADELRAKTLFRLGLAQGELGRWAECEAALSELARAFPRFANLAEGELWRGRALAAQGKARPARAAFERTLALDQGELAADARLGLGALAEQEGRLDDALSEYLKVALLYADEAAVGEALFAAGRVLEAQGAREQAAARYRELVQEHGGSPFAARAQARLRALETR